MSAARAPRCLFLLPPLAAPFYTRRIERTYGPWFLAFLGRGNREDSPVVGAGRGDQAPPVAPALNLSLMLRSDFDNRIGFGL